MDRTRRPGAGNGSTTAAGRALLHALPRFPGPAGYRQLLAALREAGLRHAGDVLRPPVVPGAGAARRDEGFRVLDGVWVPGRGYHWLLVDRAYLREVGDRWEASGDPRSPAVAGIVRRLDAALAADPMALRRIVLYQLGCLLRDSPGGPAAAAAEDLGVHPEEAELLAAAVAADGPGPAFPEAGPVREAAEGIIDAWQAHRLLRAREFARLLTPQAAVDHVLAALLERVREWADEVPALRDRAAELRRRGRGPEALRCCLRAARQAVDDPEVFAELLACAALCGDLPAGEDAGGAAGRRGAAPGRQPPRLRATVSGGVVRLRWPDPRPGAGPAVAYRAVRFPDGRPQEAVDLTPPGVGTTLLDRDPPCASPVRYAVLPLRGGRLAGPPLATPALVVTPEVARPSAAAVPEGVRLTWQPHPEAVAVLARRFPAAAPGEPRPLDGEPVPCGLDGLLDVPLPPGRYHYRVNSGYRGPSGELVWSEGRTVKATADAWPAPVAELTADPVGPDGRVRLRWSAPERGRDLLVRWSRRPVAAGEDVSPWLAELLGGLSGEEAADGTPERRLELAVQPRTATRVTVVSVLSRRAVAGPSVLIETPGTVEDLTVRRVDGGAWLAVSFRWPEPCVLVLVGLEQDGVRFERRVARSRYAAEGLRIPAGRTACRVTVTPLPRPDATVAMAGTAAATVAPAPPLPAPPPLPAGRQGPDTQPAPPLGPAAVRRLQWWRRLRWLRRR